MAGSSTKNERLQLLVAEVTALEKAVEDGKARATELDARLAKLEDKLGVRMGRAEVALEEIASLRQKVFWTVAGFLALFSLAVGAGFVTQRDLVRSVIRWSIDFDKASKALIHRTLMEKKSGGDDDEQDWPATPLAKALSRRLAVAFSYRASLAPEGTDTSYLNEDSLQIIAPSRKAHGETFLQLSCQVKGTLPEPRLIVFLGTERVHPANKPNEDFACPNTFSSVRLDDLIETIASGDAVTGYRQYELRVLLKTNEKYQGAADNQAYVRVSALVNVFSDLKKGDAP